MHKNPSYPMETPKTTKAYLYTLRVLLPIAGALLIAILYKITWLKKIQSVGVSHVMERLSYHQGYLGIRNLLLQYLGGAMAIISGQSLRS